MSGMSGGSMLRTRRKDVNIKPNRRLDRKSSRGMLYENEELRLRTININAEVERGQTDIKKLKRENEQLRREVGALRGEYDRLEQLLKARHSEELSDAEGSNSCCSECDSDCCSTQNHSNDCKDDEHPCHKIEKVTEEIQNMSSRSEGTQNVLTNGLGSCGILPAVPEEPSSPRVPSTDNKIENHYSIPFSSNNGREYYTAQVNVPLESHPIEQTDMGGPSVFPKAGLDILMNNNPNEHFRGFQSPPNIGFIVPPCMTFNDEYNQNIQDTPNFLMQSNDLNKIIIKNNDNNRMLANVDPIMENNKEDCIKDSYFLCNTRKIIQQLTIKNPKTHNTQLEENVLDDAPNDTMQFFTDLGSETSPLYKTEKSIELNNDYATNETSKDAYEQGLTEIDVNKDTETALTTHTTTEINSTVLMFARKNYNEKSKNKGLSFFRSNSAPVETNNEPVYATIKKIPHKTPRLHIANLENEVTYIPEIDINKEKNSLVKSNKINLNMPSILKNSEPESPTSEAKVNFTSKNDSFSEVEKNDQDVSSNVIPKSPVARKKKRFTIHFKRKSKKSIPSPIIDDSETPSENRKNIEKRTDLRNSSERLLELSSSWESPDLESTVRFKDTQLPYPCKKHTTIPVKNKQCNSLNGECRRTHRCEKCLANRKHGDLPKKRYSPVGSYLKHDSYQEMTTSHSERERTNSLSSSGHSGFSLNNKARKMSATPREGSIPWCGCWGNSCL